jgi:hypothetical protein
MPSALCHEKPGNVTMNTVIIIAAAILLSGLLFFEKYGNQKGKLLTKTILSCLFIFTAVVQPHPFLNYFYIILIGLIFCLGGDIFLALPQERMFLFGLVSFLLGHVFFVICFFLCGGYKSMDLERLRCWPDHQWSGVLLAAAASGNYADTGNRLYHRHHGHGRWCFYSGR